MDQTTTVDIRKQLEDHIMKTRTQNGLQGFVSTAYLRNLLASEACKKQLNEDYRDLNPREIRSLQTTISVSGSKMYGILVLLDKTELIEKLMSGEDPVTDERLFGGEGKRTKPYCEMKELNQIPGLCGIAKQFYDKQWVFPPTLSSEDDQLFPPESFVFPFHSYPVNIGQGSYGGIFEVEIAAECLKSPIPPHTVRTKQVSSYVIPNDC